MRALIGTAALALLLAACGQEGDINDVASAEAESNLSAGAAEPKEDLAALLRSEPQLAGLVQAAGMEKILSGKEPYTVLAPSKAALDALPAGTLERLQQPEGRAELTGLLRAHFLPGTILAADLARAVDSGKGKAQLATMTGEPLTVTREGETFVITDAKGGKARITGAERPARNGVMHTIDSVLPTN